MYFLSRLSSYDFRNQIDDCCLKCLSIDQREYKKYGPVPCCIMSFFKCFRTLYFMNYVYAVKLFILTYFIDVLIKGCVFKTSLY